MTLDENPPDVGEALVISKLHALRPTQLDETATNRVLGDIRAAAAEINRNPGRAAALREATAEVDRNRRRSWDVKQRSRRANRPACTALSVVERTKRHSTQPRPSRARAGQPKSCLIRWIRENDTHGSSQMLFRALLLAFFLSSSFGSAAMAVVALLALIVLALPWLIVTCMSLRDVSTPRSDKLWQIMRTISDKDKPVT
ncbi:hypothetical protein [Nocardia carnea]|uniref:hypothetical protein n=1 Tax=Nocardia carnea TaxID=37328 RepID=UPI0024583C5D|nr:hypothetical protein [Nocardia carnea]